ncbi:MAG: zf-HC2 domain-containing protein [Oscillospiraceae bacterium]
MRNCDYYEELISRSLDDELSVEERKALAVHLACCPSCSQMRQLMADISGLMEEDMEELPDGLHEDIMAAVRRSEMIKKNSRVGKSDKARGNRKIKISRPVRNLLATAACMALVIAAAVSLNPGERAESVVMARSAADESAQVQAVTESAAPESTQTPAPTASPTPSPVSTESPNVQTATLPQTGTTAVNEGTIITTPVPTVDPNADWRNPISSGSEDSSNQNRVIINQATPSPSPVVVSTPAPTPSPVATPTPTPSSQPVSQPEQAQQDAAAEEEQGSASQFQAAENGQDQQPETGSQSEISGEVHKKALDRVFSMFPSLVELTPAQTVPPQDGGSTATDKTDAVQSAGELPQVSPTPCPDAEEYDIMDDKEGGRELLLLLMGMQDENGAAPEEAQLPEGECDGSYVIAMIFDDIPCEVMVKVYGEELYFSLAEIIIDPLETAEDPASVEPSQPVEQPAPEENTMEAEAYDVAGAETQIQVQTQDSSEDFEPIWFRANCSLADFTAKLDSLTK